MGKIVNSIFAAALLAVALPAGATDPSQSQDVSNPNPQPSAARIEAGKALSMSCAGCHGATGTSVSPAFPNLAGISYDYLYRQLQDFKSGLRKSPIMAPMVMALSEDNLRDLAAYYSAQAPAALPADQAADSKLVALGREIYAQGIAANGVAACVRCHGVGARGLAGHFPRLAGQHAPYLIAQLVAYKSGQRDNDPGQMMRQQAHAMNDQEIQAVAAYLQGLH